MIEKWEQIKGFNGDYEVSSLGRIRSNDRYTRKGVFIKGKILSVRIASGGYENVTLSKNSVRTTVFVHVEVAKAFLNHTPCGYDRVVDHIDGDKLNNKVTNIQIITQRENVQKVERKSSSMYDGVCWDTSSLKWSSNIFFNKKQRHLGLFDSELEASKAYQDKLKQINNGENRKAKS